MKNDNVVNLIKQRLQAESKINKQQELPNDIKQILDSMAKEKQVEKSKSIQQKTMDVIKATNKQEQSVSANDSDIAALVKAKLNG